MFLADFEILRRFCLRRLGYKSISLHAFYKVESNVSSTSTVLADLMIQIDCGVNYAQAQETLTVSDAIAFGVGQHVHSTLVELAMLQQQFYDILITQPAGARQSSNTSFRIFVQCKWSTDSSTSNNNRLLAKWLGTMQSTLQVHFFVH